MNICSRKFTDLLDIYKIFQEWNASDIYVVAEFGSELRMYASTQWSNGLYIYLYSCSLETDGKMSNEY
jgi:hypothetical protein